jgi:hypothetical protein
MGQRLEPRERAAEVIRLAGLAIRHFEVWRVYTEQSSRDRLLKALDQFADFVNLDQHAHQELCLLYLGTLFETRDNTINISALINEASAANELFCAEKIRALLNDVNHLIKKVHLLRGNAVAHRSDKLSRVATFAKAALSPDDLRMLVDEAEQIAFAIGRAFDLEPFTIAVLAPADLDRIFTSLLPRS